MKASIAIADDHVQYRYGLANLLKELDYEVLFEAGNGQIFLDQLQNHPEPQIALIDINMLVSPALSQVLLFSFHHPHFLYSSIKQNTALEKY